MWYKEYEIKNTGKGYIIVFGHYENEYKNNISSRFDGCGDSYQYYKSSDNVVKIKKIFTYTTIYNIDACHKYLVEEIGLKYYIPYEDNYLYNGIIHFQCVNDCKRFIDERRRSNKIIKCNVKEEYSEIYDFEGSSIPKPPEPPKDRRLREGDEPPKPKNYI